MPPGESYRILAVNSEQFGGKTIMIGKEGSTVGNLGSGWHVGSSGYQKYISKIMTFDAAIPGGSPKEVSLTSDSEFIGVLPKSNEEKIGISRNEMLSKLMPTIFDTPNKDKLQLYTFLPVTVKREHRRNPRTDCVKQWEDAGYPNYEACEACPIYVYSKNVQEVTIKPKTPIFQQSAIPQLHNASWTFTADNAGNLLFPDSRLYRKIDFLFPRSKIEQPKYGIIVSSEDFASGIYQYAKNLGLNDTEAGDVVDYYMPEIKNTPYIFLSHLNGDSTKNLLDMEAAPKPELQKTYMFYVKKLVELPGIRPETPFFDKISRENSNLTVITWGGILE